MPEQRPMLDGYQRRLMSPVLDHLARPPADRLGQVHRIVAETGEEGKEVGPGDNVDRVELDDPDPIDDPAEMADIDLSGRARCRQNPAPPGQSDEPD